MFPFRVELSCLRSLSMVTLLVAAGVGEDFLGGKKRKTVQKGLVDGSTVHYIIVVILLY